ncbi:MAG: DUF429 domain-containing protein [Pseudomonadales bacterium]|nr:DUF429 domain-containing protein [Pseudomonadales bacterium]
MPSQTRMNDTLCSESPPVTLMGIDLAWQPEKNPSALATGELRGNHLLIHRVDHGITGLQNIMTLIDSVSDLRGLAIDASLVINNTTGKRDCERDLSRVYGGRKAGCHSSNLTLYPDPASVRLAGLLESRGFKLQGPPDAGHWMIECYPHPAIIELFGLPERLLYKKGNVAGKRAGQIRLARLLAGLSQSRRLKLTLAPTCCHLLDETVITGNRGQALKSHEDALDAIVCACIAACYTQAPDNRMFGDRANGHIYVPQGQA